MNHPMHASKQIFPFKTVWLLVALWLLLSAPLWLHWWEPGMFLALNAACAQWPAVVWAGLSLAGNGWGVLCLSAPLLLCAPRLMLAWLCAAPFAMVFASVGKWGLESLRPVAVIDPAQFHILGEHLRYASMPSGHTTTAFAVVSAIFFSLSHTQRRRFAWIWLLALGAGVSRIAVGAHWPGDVAVGAGLGVVAGLLGHAWLLRINAKHWAPGSKVQWLLALLVALAVYNMLSDALDFAENLPLQWFLSGWASLSLLAFAMRSAKALKAA